MSILGSILGGIFKKKEAAPAASAPAPTAAPAAPQAAPAAPAAVAPAPEVDVAGILDFMNDQKAQKLNWRTSIVDLLKLLDLDSSLAARKEQAKVLYCPDELMQDSARMNMWLHKNVLANIAANGGNVPAELLD